jgi:WhiB family transcriptional regulator, redox-sensing transcriptional regulator
MTTIMSTSSSATSTSTRLKWREQGACRGLDATMFFPDDDDPADEAKSVCAGCSVRVTCLEYALANREKQGVWGGATERERRRILRQRRRSA